MCCMPSLFSFVTWADEENNDIHDNSGDVGDAESDYTCPSWIRAFDVCFVGGVVRSGQEKQRERVIPTTSWAHCSDTATCLHTLDLPTLPTPPPTHIQTHTYRHTHLKEIDNLPCVIYAINRLRVFISNRLVCKGRSKGTVHVCVESLFPGRLASHLTRSAYRLGDLL